MTSKICSKCNIDKDLGEFHKDNNRKDGHRSACKDCINNKKPSVLKDKCNDLLSKNHKICSKCNIEKDLSEFCKNGKYHRSECKSCYKAKAKVQNNIENKTHLECEKKTCSKCLIEKSRLEFYRNNANIDGLCGFCIVCQKEYRRNNIEKIKETKRKWEKENREYLRNKQKARIKNDPSFKTRRILRCRLNAALYGNCKKQTSKDLIGCSWEDIHLYLNKKSMNDDQCDVDHIIPCHVFDFTDPNHQKACFHYTNLQKLSSDENRHLKREKLPENFNVESWVEKQLEQIKKIEDDNLGWETVLELQKTKTFQGFIDEEDKWW